MLVSEDPERDLYYGHEIGLFDKKTVLLTRESGGKLPSRGTVIVEMPPVQTPALSENVNHSQTRYARMKLLLAHLTGEGKKRARHTAVLVRNVLDARLLTLGDVAVAVGDSDTRPLPQPLKAKADVIVYPGGGNGGLAEVTEAMCQSRRALYHLWCAAVYLSASQISRMVLLLLAVLFGFAMPQTALLLGIGLVMDFAAVLVMAFIRVPEDALTIPEKQLGLPAGMRSFFGLMGLGLLWGVLEGMLPLFCMWMDTPYMGVLLASILLSQLLFSGTVGQRGSFFRCRFHVAYVLYALFAIACAAVCLLLWPVVWYAYFLALIPPVVLVAVWEIRKLRENRPMVKKAKKEKKAGETDAHTETSVTDENRQGEQTEHITEEA